MPRNVEIKARVSSLDELTRRVAGIADSRPVETDQDDTFFVCPNGRLKLRELAADMGELIFYRRADTEEPKESFYVIVPTSAPAALREALTLAYGVAGRVRKHRIVYMIGNTRVHLDRVEGLGDFLEFEVVLSENNTLEHGMAVTNDLLDKLGIPHENLVKGAYVDLMMK